MNQPWQTIPDSWPWPRRYTKMVVPIALYHRVEVTVPELGMTENEWTLFMQVLNAMKDGLVQEQS